MADLWQAWLASGCPLRGAPSWRALQLLAGYAAAVAVGGVVVPGQRVRGTVLPDGTSLEYPCNGLALALAAISAIAAAALSRAAHPEYIADVAGELFATTLVLSVVIAAGLYAKGIASSSASASLRPRLSGSVALDFWLGLQLNPSFLGLDLKWFCLRLGMLGWLILNLSVALKQHSTLGTITTPMLLYQVFAGVYVLDFFWHEEYMTTTWDIIAEGFGFMLVFGDLVWIPFTFSLQAWWLLHHDSQISLPFALLQCLLFLAGYTIFRGANAQKHLFKRNPNQLIWGRLPRVVGGRLLASGFWGISRHSNYLGDLLLALSLSLPCAFSSPIPYFYPLYLLILLINRERRDESRCRAKYKETWEEYCSLVPWRIFPYIY